MKRSRADFLGGPVLLPGQPGRPGFRDAIHAALDQITRKISG